MIVAVPPGRSIANACSAVAFRPIASNAYSTPPSVMSMTLATPSPSEALTVSVAPNERARSSLASTMSTAMMRAAPAMRAPWTAERPTPPHPMTATLDPAGTAAEFSTAPSPVVTPQPTRAARSRGMSLVTFTTAFSCTSICSA